MAFITKTPEKESPRRGRPREFDRAAALVKALELFWRQGYLQTSICQLCSAMGIKSPSLYCAFKSKAALFLEALQFYRNTYWEGAFTRFMENPDLYAATKNLFEETAKILLMPDAPCGCLTVVSALTLPPEEKEVLAAIDEVRNKTRTMFRQRLMIAIRDGQIPADSNIPAISGALANFFEGLDIQAREDICLSELTEIALQGCRLLPPTRS